MKYAQLLLSVATVYLIEAHAAAEEDSARAIASYVSLMGADSHVKERSYHLITSEDEWIKIWQRHKGAKEAKDYDLFYNPLGLPQINFEKCMVIAVFQGRDVNSAGLMAAECLEDQGSIVFRFKDKGYQTGANGDDATVYGFFVLPRSSKVVVLEEDVQNLKGQPAKWKERVRLSNKTPSAHQ